MPNLPSPEDTDYLGPVPTPPMRKPEEERKYVKKINDKLEYENWVRRMLREHGPKPSERKWRKAGEILPDGSKSDEDDKGLTGG